MAFNEFNSVEHFIIHRLSGVYQSVKPSDDNIGKLSATAALTELFLELKTDQTPAVVERIVTEIDRVVKAVRYQGWKDSAAGRREVQKALRGALLKFKLHREQGLFDRAYAYIEQYY